MGTRSDIIVKRQDGKWAKIYCHWDGYLDNNGVVLAEHYNTQELAEAVVAPGDMSSLHEKCDKPEGHSYDNRVAGYTVYYHRDRGEPAEDTAGIVGDSLAEVWPGADAWTEYTYVWSDGSWRVGLPRRGPGGLVALVDALKLNDEGKSPWGEDED